MMKALLVVMTMTGSEYNVNMPDMETCMEQAKIVSSQKTEVEVLCIPGADVTDRVEEPFREFFNFFDGRIEEFQSDESYSRCGGRPRDGAPYSKRTLCPRQLYTN